MKKQRGGVSAKKAVRDSGSRNWALLRIGLQQTCAVAFAHAQPCLGALGVQSSPCGWVCEMLLSVSSPPLPPIGSLLSPLVQPHFWGDYIV